MFQLHRSLANWPVVDPGLMKWARLLPWNHRCITLASSFLSISSFALLSSLVLGFNCLSALSPHSPALIHNPLQPVPQLEARMWPSISWINSHTYQNLTSVVNCRVHVEEKRKRRWQANNSLCWQGWSENVFRLHKTGPQQLWRKNPSDIYNNLNPRAMW